MSACSYPFSDDRYVRVVNRREEWKIEFAKFKGNKGMRMATLQYQLFTEIVGDIAKSNGYDTNIM